MGPALFQPILIGWHEAEGALKRRPYLGWGPEPVLLSAPSIWHHAALTSPVPRLLASPCCLLCYGGSGVASLQE